MKPHSATPDLLPDLVEPMKAKLAGSVPPGDWIYEIKFDGYRAFALRGGSEGVTLGSAQQFTLFLPSRTLGGNRDRDFCSLADRDRGE